MQGFAFAANVRNDGPHCSISEVVANVGYGPETVSAAQTPWGNQK